jgi:hypothetical protein
MMGGMGGMMGGGMMGGCKLVGNSRRMTRADTSMNSFGRWRLRLSSESRSVLVRTSLLIHSRAIVEEQRYGMPGMMGYVLLSISTA